MFSVLKVFELNNDINVNKADDSFINAIKAVNVNIIMINVNVIINVNITIIWWICCVYDF